MIKSFADKRTWAVFHGLAQRGLMRHLARRARAKLILIDEAGDFSDLRMPPANRLEALRGDRRGQYSIRINRQWRICFAWRRGDAFDVEIVDYH